jgi:solute carrier family 25 protein 44
MSESDEPRLKHDIEWAMLDKSRYIPLSLLSTFVVRSLLYPFTLVRTRLQVQIQSTIYRGTWHALNTTVRHEGFRSLYKGFLVYNCQLLPGLIYITTFESTRAQANRLTKNEYLRAGIGGAVGSLCSQVLACPIDIISQHMQLVGLTSPVRKIRSKDGISSVSDANLSTSASHRLQQRQIRRIHVPKEIRANNYLIFKHICRTLLYEKIDDKNRQTKFSLKGFYRGYFISTFLFSLTSAIWWPSYYFYQRQLLRIETIFRKRNFLFYKSSISCFQQIYFHYQSLLFNVSLVLYLL